jgi:hypothetical protein
VNLWPGFINQGSASQISDGIIQSRVMKKVGLMPLDTVMNIES